MCYFEKFDIREMIKDMDVSECSHLIICVNRVNGCCLFRCVNNGENLDEVMKRIEDEGIYGIVSVHNISDLFPAISECIDECSGIEVKTCDKSTSEEALDFAKEMHIGQQRRDGSPYIEHPIRVANYVSSLKESKSIETLRASAYLHDTLEDTSATYYDLVGKFGSQVASIVLELTNDEDLKKEIGKTRYLEIKMKNMSSWALVVKLCDRLDNVSDLMYRDETFRNRYVRETAEIMDYLLENRELSNTHLSLIKKIMECLSKCRIQCSDVETKIESVGTKLKSMA